jgi:hypothetical protein
MATACRKMARDLRAEAAAGWGSIGLTSIGGPDRKVTRWQAAASLDRQAERWEAEARGEGENVLDRERIGW